MPGTSKKEFEQIDGAAATLIAETLKIFSKAESGGLDLH